VQAYANPSQAANGAGFVVIRLNQERKEVTFEYCLRNADLGSPDAEQFPGSLVLVEL
jgi:hypothetical protein